MAGPETTRPTELVQPIIDEIVNLRAQRATGGIEASVMVEGVLNRADQIVRMGVSDPDISAYFKHVARDGDVWQGLIDRISKNREMVQASPDPVLDQQIKADLALADALGMGENEDISPYLNNLKVVYAESGGTPPLEASLGEEIAQNVQDQADFEVSAEPPPGLAERGATSAGEELSVEQLIALVPDEKRLEVKDVLEQLGGAFRARHETFVSTDLDSGERQTRLAQLDDQINALQVQLSDTLGLKEEENAQAAQAAEAERNSLHMISIANLLMASARGSTYENNTFEETGGLLRKLYAGSTPEVRQALEHLLARNTLFDWEMGQEDSSLTTEFNDRLHEAAGLYFDAGSILLGERYSHARRSFENLASGRTAGGLDELVRVFRDKNRFQREHFQDLSARIRKVGDYERELASKAGMEIFYE